MPAESVCYCRESSGLLLFCGCWPAMDLIKLLEFMDEDDEEIVLPRVYFADVSNPMELLTDSEFTVRYRFSKRN